MGCSEFQAGHNLVSDKEIIAEHFNDFFVNIGKNLALEMPTDYFSLTRCNDSMFLRPITEKELRDIIAPLQKSAAGFVNIKPHILTYVTDSIASLLAHTIKLSFTWGKVPDRTKIA